MHFTDTGRAMFANLFLETINDALGTEAPLIELDPIASTDPGPPSAIAALGLDVSRCD